MRGGLAEAGVADLVRGRLAEAGVADLVRAPASPPAADEQAFLRLAAALPPAPEPREARTLVAAASGATAYLLRRGALAALAARFPEVAAAALAAGRAAAAARTADRWHALARARLRRGREGLQQLLRSIVAVGIRWATARRKMKVDSTTARARTRQHPCGPNRPHAHALLHPLLSSPLPRRRRRRRCECWWAGRHLERARRSDGGGRSGAETVGHCAAAAGNGCAHCKGLQAVLFYYLGGF